MQGVYLICFNRPYGTRGVRHCLGWSSDVHQRVKTHKEGGPKSARLLAALKDAGVKWQVSKIWVGKDRKVEAGMKKQKKSFARVCPLCKGRRHTAMRFWTEVER